MKRVLLGLLLAGAAGSARADVLFASDFQTGGAAPWAAAGAGDVRLTTYEGNVSLRLVGDARAVVDVAAAGRAQVVVRLKLAAASLGGTGRCLGEVSVDQGRSWRTVLAVGPGQDDGLTLHAGVMSVPDAGATLRLRLRAEGGGAATCWADDVAVSGAEPSAGAPKVELEAVLAGAGYPEPVDLSAYAPGPDAQAPSHRFEGRLTLTGPRRSGGFRELKHDYQLAGGADPTRADLPPFDFAFVQDGDSLIPAVRGPVDSGGFWDWVLQPGRVWDAPGDGGLTRAAIPFSLQERNANCLHDGMLSFRFGADATVSDVAFQISGETCAYDKFDLWGLSAARYAPGDVAGADALVAARRAEAAARLPVRPLATLAEGAPGVDPGAFALAPTTDGDPPSAFGVVWDGVHYAGGCDTRAGAYPACDELDLPSYSTAKTIVAAVALMRLERLHPGIARARIADYVPECARWGETTFADALNMATGFYDSAAFTADEDAAKTMAFFLAEDHAAKIAFACGSYPKKAPAGRTWVYRTSDTYLLGTAMQAWLKRHEGAERDLYRDVVAPLWTALKLGPTLSTTRRTYDDVGQPFTGWGLTYQRDDIARIAVWLSQGAATDGEPTLDPAMLNSALQRDPAARGLEAGGPTFRYRYGLWARDLSAALGCPAPVFIPFMSGFGGISVVLLPNRAVYYHYGDGAVFDWGPAAIELHKIRSLCDER